MCLKLIKWGVVGLAGTALVGGLMFGADGFSYLTSSARSMRTAVKDSVPIEFELRRARDLLEDIIPEMQANIRLIAQEEVEVAGLKSDIERSQVNLEDERTRVVRLRGMLETRQVAFTIGGLDYTRDQIKNDLARRFEQFKEGEIVLAGKQRLLETRQKSLHAAMQVLEQTRAQKAHLEDQIAALESQYRLVKAASVNSPVQIDHSKIAQTTKLIAQIKKRLDVAERVLAHETQFVQPIPVDVISEQDLLTEVDEHLSPPETVAADEDEIDGSVALHDPAVGEWSE